MALSTDAPLESHPRPQPPHARPVRLVAIWLIALAGPAAILSPAPAAPPTPDFADSPGFWLLDQAWQQAAGLEHTPDRADAVAVLALLQAATRLDPKLAPAWRDQYDLLESLGRGEQAVQALERYLAVAPDDEVAQFGYVAARIGAAQTAEQRMASIREWLRRDDLAARSVAFLHRTLAEILQSRLQTAEAREHARQAVEAFPYDLEARRLLQHLQDEPDPLADLRMALWMARRNPADVAALLAIARSADNLGLTDIGTTWFTAAQRIVERLDQRSIAMDLEIADHWLDMGQTDFAFAVLDRARRAPGAPPEVQLLLAEAHRMTNNPNQARQAAAAAIRDTGTQPATRPASMDAQSILAAARDYTLNAWVRLLYLDEAAAALPAARGAFELAPDQPWARRAYGWALLRTGQPIEAVDILRPIAQTDAWAALGLAQALHKSGNAEAAATTLATVQRLAPSGAAHRAARRWAQQVGLPMPGPDAALQRQARQLLTEFPEALLQLPLRPDRFVQLRISPDRPPAPGEPWFGRIELANVGQVPVYLGPDGALTPHVLVSAVVYDPAFRDINQRLLLSLHRQFVLEPGESIALRRPLDSGPLRSLLRDPTREVDVGFSALLDPLRTADGRWLPSPLGQSVTAGNITRPAGEPASYEDLASQARSAATARKIEAAHRIASLLAARRDRAGRPTAPSPEQAPLVAAMAQLLGDRDVAVAARALALAYHVPLTDALAQAAAPHVSSEHWLLRLLAVRLFAHHQGAAFARALGGMARGDPDPLVRDLASAYHGVFAAQAGRP